MPLVGGWSREAVSKNISKEIAAGVSRKQAIAIALSHARSEFKKANKGKPLPKHLKGGGK